MREENGEGIGRYSDPYTGYGSRYRLYEGRGRYGYSPYYDGGYYNDYAGAFRTLAERFPDVLFLVVEEDPLPDDLDTRLSQVARIRPFTPEQEDIAIDHYGGALDELGRQLEDLA